MRLMTLSQETYLKSIHLNRDDLRLEEFRAARERLNQACGNFTICGGLRELESDDPGDGATLASPPVVGLEYFLYGDHSFMERLSPGVNSIGRLSDNTIVIRDEHVSRRHCAIVLHRDGSAELHDVASKNGTILNGRKINGPTRLKNGDKITLCTRVLTFRFTRAANAKGKAEAEQPEVD